MAEFRIGMQCTVALLVTLAVVQQGRTQTAASSTNQSIAINKVYSLADLGDDPNLCKWIAETIPQMIRPGCWTGQNLCYYAPAKVLAIHQTPDVHAQVEAFLASMRKSLPRGQTIAKYDPQIAPAQFAPVQFNPDGLRPVGTAPASQPYPVPTSLQAPKHLFHFIIRYEGEGIIDSNVTKFTEVLTKASVMDALGQSAMPMQYVPDAGISATPPTWSVPMTGLDGGIPANVPRTMPPADAPMIAPQPVRTTSVSPLPMAPPPPTLPR